MSAMTHEQKLLAAIEAYENKGNTAEEFGWLLGEAKQTGWEREAVEARNTARQNIRRLPYGDDILSVECQPTWRPLARAASEEARPEYTRPRRTWWESI